MFCRLAATVLAGALVTVPPVRAGLDGGFASRRPAVAALTSGSFSTTLLAARSVAAQRGSAPTAGTEGAPGSDDGDDGDTEPASRALRASDVARFGFGPRTGFYPSDGPRELVLSFDDGPDLKFTPLVLDELDRRGLKAIFFVTGHRVVGDRPEDLARRELLGRIAAHGHLVANHTMTHANLCQAPDAAAAEIDQNSEVIAQATGVRPLLFRAPYGARCRSLEAALLARQLVSVGWNLDPQDWKNPTSSEILAYLQARLSRLRGRGILLLHDTHPASVFALGPLLDWIARENRRAVEEGGTPIMLRDYSVFLPARALPQTGVVTVAASVLQNAMAGITGQLGWSATSARQ
jgi:peptidoglycan/xylan/chitin deacetylase (PgdA/CDA1 family)